MRSANGETRGIRPTLTGTISYTGGTKSVTNTDIEARSFSIRTGTSVPDSLSVGAAVMGSVKFTLLNKNGKYNGVVWKGATFSFTLTIVNGNTTNVFRMGTYYVVSHSESGDRIEVECYDHMKLLDEYEIYEDMQNYGLTFPNNFQGVVDAVLTRHHNLSYTGLANPTTGIIEPRSDTMTERQLLSCIAQMNGQYIIIRPDPTDGHPVLHFEWYNTNQTYNAGTTFSHTLRTTNLTVTGVKVTSYNGDYTYTDGTGDTLIEIENNPFITASTCQFYAERIHNAIGNLSFRPGTVEIRGTPVIEAGDCLIVQTGEESNIKTLVTNLTYTLELTIQSTADAPPYEGDLNIVRSRYIRSAAKQAISEDLHDPDSELSKALGGGKVVHFPKTVMECYDPTHWATVEAPCDVNTSGVFITYGRDGQGKVTATYTSDGYDFNSVVWMGCDVCIPPYDANSSEYFDVTMYLLSVNAFNTAQTHIFDFLGEVNHFYYPVAIHTRAKYADSSTLKFESQWLLMPANYEMSGMPVSGLMIPLPSTMFDMSTGEWVVDMTIPPSGTTYYAPVTYL